MRVLVTGAGGMLGSAFVRQLGDAAVGLTREELDITDSAAVTAVAHDIRPSAIVNCAAYTDVDGAEKNEQLATQINGDGAGNVAAAATATGAKVLHFSTDYVFDGEKREPYVESDPVNPQSAYGRSKLAGERAVAAANPQHIIVRTSWLFGAGGRNFVDTMLTVGRERGEVKVVADQVGCPTWAGHLAAAFPALLEAGPGILHVAGAGRCSWYEFAVEIFRQAGVDVQVTPCSTAEFPRPAPRPTFSVLGSERGAPVLEDWQEGLRGYLSERVAAR